MQTQQNLPGTNEGVEVVLLDGGGFTTTDDWRLHADGGNQQYYLCNWCFLIQHKASGTNMLWDLGISNDRTLYTPWVLKYMWTSCNPVGPRQSLVDQLRDLGIDRNEIDTIIFSHAHWDHCRPVKSEFPNARVFFGPGTTKHCGLDPMKGVQELASVQWDSRFFSSDQDARTELSEEVSGPWLSWAGFEAAVDYFRDGSFWIIQAPGHMPGNLAACARLPTGERILLASDCCHSRAIFDGTREIADVEMPDGSRACLHHDLDAALDTIQKLRNAVGTHRVHVAMAHDPEFIKEGTDDVLMSILHPALATPERLRRIREGLRP